MNDYGGWNALDEPAYVTNYAAMTALAVWEMTMSAPSGAELYRAIALNAVAIPNTVPPFPFQRVSELWGQFAENLDPHRQTLEGILQQIGGDSNENLWTGDGATAFHDYVDKKMLDGINQMATTAGFMRDTLQGLTEGWSGITVALVKGYAFLAACIAYQIAIQPTKAIPLVGMGIFAGLTWESAIIESVLWADLLFFLLLDLQGYSQLQSQIDQHVQKLKQIFGDEGRHLEQEATRVRNREPGTIIGDPTEWSKDQHD